ncbi:hypothetical protein J2X72_004897 [Phyllobacterium sp. 1468]|nr:hypothetical protein [Phyllobacterium sp. 1468]
MLQETLLIRLLIPSQRRSYGLPRSGVTPSFVQGVSEAQVRYGNNLFRRPGSRTEAVYARRMNGRQNAKWRHEAAIFCNIFITLWSENGAVEKIRISG